MLHLTLFLPSESCLSDFKFYWVGKDNLGLVYRELWLFDSDCGWANDPDSVLALATIFIVRGRSFQKKKEEFLSKKGRRKSFKPSVKRHKHWAHVKREREYVIFKKTI